MNRKDVIFVLLLGGIDLAVELVHLFLGPATLVEQSVLHGVTNIPQLWRAVGYLPATLGFLLLPFALAFFLQKGRRVQGAALWLGLAAAALGIIGGIASLQHALAGESILPGDIWTQYGFVPTLPAFHKPPLFGPTIEAVVELLAVASFGLLLVVRWNFWPSLGLGSVAGLLVLLALFQSALTVTTFVYDRYYLVPAAALVPVLAAAASRAQRPRLAMGWGVGAAVAGIALYAVAQQDYEAWQAARDRVARAANRVASPARVVSGYEPQGRYWTIPSYEADPSIDPAQLMHMSVWGPDQAWLVLRFAGPSDPRPGVTYDSLAPGKIIVVGTPPRGKTLDFSP